MPCKLQIRLVETVNEMPPRHSASSRNSTKLPNTLLRDREDASFVEARPSALIVKNEKRQTGSNLHDGEGWQRNSFMQTRCFGNRWCPLSLRLDKTHQFSSSMRKGIITVSAFFQSWTFMRPCTSTRYFQLRCNGRFGHWVRLRGLSSGAKLVRFVLQKLGKL